MAITININDASEMTDREITAMLAFLRTLSGECEQAPTVDESPIKDVAPAPITEPEAPVLVADVETVNVRDYVVTTVSPLVPIPAPDLASVFAAPLPPTPTVERDTAGLPWDARIHAASKATIADGTWRMRRNVDEAEVTQIEAEMRAVLNVAPAAPAPTPTTNAPTLDWKLFLNVMTKHITEKRITTQQISEICRSLDLRHPGDLQIRPDQFPAFEAAVRVITGDAV